MGAKSLNANGNLFLYRTKRLQVGTVNLGQLGGWAACPICRVPGVQPSGSSPFSLLLGQLYGAQRLGGSEFGASESRRAPPRQRTQENIGYTGSETTLKWARWEEEASPKALCCLGTSVEAGRSPCSTSGIGECMPGLKGCFG